MRHVIKIYRDINRGLLGCETKYIGKIIIEAKEDALGNINKIFNQLGDIWQLATVGGLEDSSVDYWEILEQIKRRMPVFHEWPYYIKGEVYIDLPEFEGREAIREALRYLVYSKGARKEWLSPEVWITIQILHFGSENYYIFNTNTASTQKLKRTLPPLIVVDGITRPYHSKRAVEGLREGYEKALDWIEKLGAVIVTPR